MSNTNGNKSFSGRKRRPSLKINETDRMVLNFFWSGEFNRKGYDTYAADPRLVSFTHKSKRQLQRSLRKLESLGILRSSAPKPFRGTPILYHLLYPKFKQLKALIGKVKGNMLSIYFLSYIKTHHNPMPSWELAATFGVSKRTAQRAIKNLKDANKVRLTRVRRKGRKRIGKFPSYELGKGRIPLTHWIPNKKEKS